MIIANQRCVASRNIKKHLDNFHDSFLNNCKTQGLQRLHRWSLRFVAKNMDVDLVYMLVYLYSCLNFLLANLMSLRV